MPTVLGSPPGRVRTLATTLLRRELGLPVEAIRTDIPPRPETCGCPRRQPLARRTGQRDSRGNTQRVLTAAPCNNAERIDKQNHESSSPESRQISVMGWVRDAGLTGRCPDPVPMRSAPADSPKTVTLPGSPPNAAMFTPTHSSAATWSSRAMLAYSRTQARRAGVGEPRRGRRMAPLRPNLHRMLLLPMGLGRGCVSLRSQQQHQPGQHGERV